MKPVEITRRPSEPTGTFGRLLLPWLGWEMPTLELPWANNEPKHSCIPAGTYRAQLAASTKWSPRSDGALYHVLGVPGRTLIKIHAATWAGDEREGWYAELLGCIAPGGYIGSLTPTGYRRPQPCLLESREALRQFMKRTEGDDLEIVVRWDADAEPRTAVA